MPKPARQAVHAFETGIHLLRHPGELPDWWRGLRTRSTELLGLGLPWFSYGAIRALDTRLTPRSEVVEYGSGGSTVFYAERAGRVDTVENEPAWVEQVRDALRGRGLGNATVVAVDTDLSSIGALVASGFVRAHGRDAADVVSIDSRDDRDLGLRPVIFREACALVRPGGTVVLDDHDRYADRCPPPAGWRMELFRGPGPGRRGLHSTALYHRPEGSPNRDDPGVSDTTSDS